MGTLIEDVDASVAARTAALAAEAAERLQAARRRVKKLSEATRWMGHLDPQPSTATESNGDIVINVRLFDAPGVTVSLSGQWKLRYVEGDVSRALGAVAYSYRRVGDEKPWPLVAVDNAGIAGQRAVRPVVELADIADLVVRG